MSEKQRPRGRPKRISDAHTVASNRIIGRTVHCLLLHGFALRTRGARPGVAECVGEQAKIVLHRTCPAGKSLGPDQIEKIHEAWVKIEQEERRLAKRWPLAMPNWYTKESLSQGRPTNSQLLPSLVRELLENGGVWRSSSAGLIGDQVLTPSRQKALGPSIKFERPAYDIATRAMGNAISDEVWGVIQNLLPQDKTPGRPRKWSDRDTLNAIAYIKKNNCSWRQLPKNFPPWKTVHETYVKWRSLGIVEQLLNAVDAFPDKM